MHSVACAATLSEPSAQVPHGSRPPSSSPSVSVPVSQCRALSSSSRRQLVTFDSSAQSTQTCERRASNVVRGRARAGCGQRGLQRAGRGNGLLGGHHWALTTFSEVDLHASPRSHTPPAAISWSRNLRRVPSKLPRGDAREARRRQFTRADGTCQAWGGKVEAWHRPATCRSLGPGRALQTGGARRRRRAPRCHGSQSSRCGCCRARQRMLAAPLTGRG